MRTLLVILSFCWMVLGCSEGGSGGTAGSVPEAINTPLDPNAPGAQVPVQEEAFTGKPVKLLGTWTSKECLRLAPDFTETVCKVKIKISKHLQETLLMTIADGNFTENIVINHVDNQVLPSNVWAKGRIGADALKMEYDYLPEREGLHFYILEMVLISSKLAEVRWRNTVYINEVPRTFEHKMIVRR